MYEEEIEQSGFYEGVEFSTAQEVAEYFTVDNMKSMFSGECAWSQETLDAMRDECLQKPLFEMTTETVKLSSGMEVFVSRPRTKLQMMSMTEVGGFLSRGKIGK